MMVSVLGGDVTAVMMSESRDHFRKETEEAEQFQ